jgi:hypothetical protein
MTAAARALATSPSRAASARRRVPAETAAYWALEGIRWLAAWLPEGLLETAAAAIGDIAFFGTYCTAFTEIHLQDLRDSLALWTRTD